MNFEIKFPRSWTSDGIIESVLVTEGDHVGCGQDVVEIYSKEMESEFIDGHFRLESPYAGRVTKVHVSRGQVVTDGTPLIVVEAIEPPALIQVPRLQATRAVAQGSVSVSREAALRPSQAHLAVVASPATRRVARELRVDLQKMRGTGPGGRITLEDVLQFANRFYSCFISYSRTDKRFAKLLHDYLQAQGVHCWLDEKQIHAGDKIHTEVDRGIRESDKILLCASMHSCASWWVDNEINSAMRKEQSLWKQSGTESLVLIPIDLDGYLFSDEWQSGWRDQVRSRLAADFCGWKRNKGKLQQGFDQVLDALRVHRDSAHTQSME